MSMCTHTCARHTCGQRTSHLVTVFVLSFHHGDSGAPTQVTRFGAKQLYLLSHLASKQLSLLSHLACLHPLLSKRTSLTSQSLPSKLGCMTNEPQGSICLCLLGTGITTVHLYTLLFFFFYIDSGGLNLDLHTCAVSTV